MWKKVVAIVVVVAAAVGLAAWGAGPKSIATTDAGSITQSAYYSSLKKTSQGQTILANMVINKVLDKKYGSDIDNDAITASFKSVSSQYGSSFASALATNNLTEESFRESLKLQALEKAAVAANSKFTTKQLKKAYNDYTPTVHVSVILVSDEDKAKEIIQKLQDGEDFAKLAKSDSTDSATASNGGKMDGFDSTNTTLEDDFKTAAFALKKGEYTTTPVKSSTYSGYFVIKMDSRDKKKSYSALKTKMKNILVENKMSDTDYVQAIVGKELAAANVNIKDTTLKSALQAYTTAAASSQAADKSGSKSSSKSSSSASSASSSSTESSSSESSTESSSSEESSQE